MEIKTVITGFIILVIFIVVYRFLFVDPTSTNIVSLSKGDKTTVKSSRQLGGNAEAPDFSYSFWIYVKDWNVKLGKKKSIIKRVSTGGDVSPEIYLAENTNNLGIDVSVYSSTGGSGGKSNCTVRNIPLQKWTHIVVTTNNRALDVYIDGKLVKTHLLSGPIKVSGTAPVRICSANTNSGEPGFDGYVAKVKYFSRTLNPREVYEIYKQGYSGSVFGSLLNKYRLRLSYIKDNEEVGALEI